MKIKTTLAVIALMLTPALAAAEGCSKMRSEASISCAEGSVWNPDTRTCEITSS